MKNLIIATILIISGCEEIPPKYYVEDTDSSSNTLDSNTFNNYDTSSERIQQDTSVFLEECEGELYFPDPILDKVIRLQAGKPEGPLYYEDIEHIRTIQASMGTTGLITDLTGLKCFDKLTSLHLYGTTLSTLDELSTVTSLVRLFLHETGPYTDIAALENLTNLDYIVFENVKITNLSPLVNNSGIFTEDYISLGDNTSNNMCNNSIIQEQVETLENRGVDIILWCNGDN